MDDESVTELGVVLIPLVRVVPGLVFDEFPLPDVWLVCVVAAADAGAVVEELSVLPPAAEEAVLPGAVVAAGAVVAGAAVVGAAVVGEVITTCVVVTAGAVLLCPKAKIITITLDNNFILPPYSGYWATTKINYGNLSTKELGNCILRN